ncbi:hypothetical protein [Maribellus sp. YY47]|uniref:hypothetical protein n=1 Tax=Maribellus sp. YY47 TaxID=2929486 RepID=UPI0020012CC7|nr:hypothetical protein [Maribellus sp. YY47]MCK3682752.1 hypothetical protein [Maribellus sp. YY47]
MNRAVTTEETQRLFDFCRAQNVEHYDLQIELVDHLASSIEEQWEKWPELSFEYTLTQAFKNFGKKGFTEICKVKKKELNKKYTHLHMQFFYRFFRWPQILLTFILTYLLFEIIVLTGSFRTTYFIYFAIALSALAFFYLYWFPRKIKFELKDNAKFLMLELLKQRYQHFVLFAFLPLNILNVFTMDIFPKEKWTTLSFQDLKVQLTVVLMAFLMVCFAILTYSFSVYATKKIKEHFLAQYPEFVK